MSVDWPCIELPEIDSTNLEARRRAALPGFHDQWIVAARQVAGRGRMGRSWSSPEGNLFASALYREPGGLPVATRASFAAALAVCDAIEAFCPAAPPCVKWPNDVRVDGRKIAGILLETGSDARSLWVVAGIGVNVRIAPENTGQPVTSLAAHLDNPPPSANEVCIKLRKAFTHWLDCSRTRPNDLFDGWRQRADGLGRGVEVIMGEARLRGVFEDIDERGAMLLRLPEGGLKPIWAGDVTLSRTE